MQNILFDESNHSVSANKFYVKSSQYEIFDVMAFIDYIGQVSEDSDQHGD